MMHFNERLVEKRVMDSDGVMQTHLAFVQKADELGEARLTTAIVEIMNTLARFGCYSTEECLQKTLSAVIRALDGPLQHGKCTRRKTHMEHAWHTGTCTRPRVHTPTHACTHTYTHTHTP